MGRSPRIATILALAGLLAALLAPAAGAAEPLFFGEFIDSPGERLASESLLRLTDLPAGFVRGEDSYCGRPSEASEYEGTLEQEEHLPPNPSEAFLENTGGGFCVVEYERLYRAPGTGTTPATLISFALATPSPAAAAEGLALGTEPYEYTLDVGDFSAAAAPAIGEETRLFHTDRGRFGYLSNLPGTLLLWRQGALIGGVFAVSTKATVSDAAAAAYAARQQSYLAAPRPYLASEAEDIPTFLGNPTLGVPVYWLGTTFRPGHGVEPSYFSSAYGPANLTNFLPGRKMTTIYNPELFLDSWTPAGWDKFSKTEVGRRQWSWHCTRSESIKLPNGHADIYAAYKKGYKTCPSFAPHHFSAHVFLPGAVIEFGEATCRYCQGNLTPKYDSWRAMKAVARGLRRYKP